MLCCTGYCAAEAQFDRKVAERDLRRYRRRGADATTRLILAELRRWPLEGRRLVDVDGGIGVISRELAGTGVASATIVEASSAYLEVARREAGSLYGICPTQFIIGNFAVIAGTLPEADVVTLHLTDFIRLGYRIRLKAPHAPSYASARAKFGKAHMIAMAMTSAGHKSEVCLDASAGPRNRSLLPATSFVGGAPVRMLCPSTARHGDNYSHGHYLATSIVAIMPLPLRRVTVTVARPHTPDRRIYARLCSMPSNWHLNWRHLMF